MTWTFKEQQKHISKKRYLYSYDVIPIQGKVNDVFVDTIF